MDVFLALTCCSCTETFTVAITHGFSANRLCTFIFVQSTCLQTFIQSIRIYVYSSSESKTKRQTDWEYIRLLKSPLDILLVVVALFPDQLCCQSSSTVHIRIPLLVIRHSVCKSSPLRKSLTFTKVTGFNLYGGWKFQLSGPQCVGLSSKLLQMKRAGGSLNYSKWNKRLCHSTVQIRQERKRRYFSTRGSASILCIFQSVAISMKHAECQNIMFCTLMWWIFQLHHGNSIFWIVWYLIWIFRKIKR